MQHTAISNPLFIQSDGLLLDLGVRFGSLAQCRVLLEQTLQPLLNGRLFLDQLGILLQYSIELPLEFFEFG